MVRKPWAPQFLSDHSLDSVILLFPFISNIAHVRVHCIQGCHGQGKVRENKILFKVREKSGSFVSGQGVSKSLFKVSEKSVNFILRLPQTIL